MKAGGSGRRRWIGSFAMALVIHVALIATALLLRTPASPADAGAMDAVLVELAPEPLAPPSPPLAVAPGPVRAQSEPQPQPAPKPLASPQQRPAVPVESLESVSVEDPDVVDPSPATPVTSEPAHAQEASQASAPPSVDAQVRETYAAPQNVAGNRHQAAVSWHGLLLGHLERHRRYPRQAERRGEQGVSYVRFDVDHRGNVANASVVRGSGHVLLDAEALATVRRASPVPPPPDSLPGASVEVVVPVEFFISL